MNNIALVQAVKDLSLPEHIVRAVIHDYLEFLKERQNEKYLKFDARLRKESDLHDRMYFETQGSMLAATLMLTLEDDVDTNALFHEVYGAQKDADLLDMRKELVSRAIAQAKDSTSLSGLSLAKVKTRKALFCQE